MRNDTFYCEIITQESRETAYDFSKAIMVRVNEIMNIPGVIGTPFVMPTSDTNGRREVILQWLVTNDKGFTSPDTILGYALQLGNDKEKVCNDAETLTCRQSLMEGYELCVQHLIKIVNS